MNTISSTEGLNERQRRPLGEAHIPNCRDVRSQQKTPKRSAPGTGRKRSAHASFPAPTLTTIDFKPILAERQNEAIPSLYPGSTLLGTHSGNMTGINRAAALGAAAAAAAAAAHASSSSGSKALPSRHPTEIPKLALSGPDGVSKVRNSSTDAALRNLADTTISLAARERNVQIIEENVAALRRELDELDRASDQALSLTMRESRASSCRLAKIKEPTSQALPESRVTPRRADSCANALVAATEALNSARESYRNISMSGRPLPPGQTTSPRLDESCNSARESVHSLMTRESVHVKLDKMSEEIRSMLLAGMSTLKGATSSYVAASTAPDLEEEKSKQEADSMMSPQSLTSEGDATTGIRPSSRDGSLQPSASVKASTLRATEKQVGFATTQSSSSVDAEVVSAAVDEACENEGLSNEDKDLQDENQGLRERLEEAEAQNEKMAREMEELQKAIEKLESCGAPEGLPASCLSAESCSRRSSCAHVLPSSSNTATRTRANQAPTASSSSSIPTVCWPSAPLHRVAPASRILPDKRQSTVRWRSLGGSQRSLSSPRIAQCIGAPQPLRSSSLTAKAGHSCARAPPEQCPGPTSSSASSRAMSPSCRLFQAAAPQSLLGTSSSSILIPGADTKTGRVHGCTIRTRSSSPLGSLCAAATETPAFAWSSRGLLAAQSAPVSRSPSPVSSVAVPAACDSSSSLTKRSAPVQTSRNHTSAKIGPRRPSEVLRVCSRSPSPCQRQAAAVITSRTTELASLVKVRDSPPRRSSPRGSLVCRSHWRLVRNSHDKENKPCHPS